MRVRWTRPALTQLREITDYIARNNPAADAPPLDDDEGSDELVARTGRQVLVVR